MEHETQKFSDISLYSQATFKILATYEITRAQRYPSPITILHISLESERDKTRTHPSLRRLFSETINSSLRASDIPAYYGDGYLVLLPATDRAGGEAVVKRLIEKIKGTGKLVDGSLNKFDFHIGIATHPGGEEPLVRSTHRRGKLRASTALQAGPRTYKHYSET